MKLNQIISKPQLTQVVLDNEEVVKLYGEPLEWWVWDRQPLDKFFKMMNADASSGEQIVAVLTEMILDETGEPLLKDGASLPTNILMMVVTKMTEIMGK
jgi:hypothetical protein